MKLVATLPLLLIACAAPPRGIHDPDDIPNHPVRGEIDGLDFELGNTWIPNLQGPGAGDYVWLGDRSYTGHCDAPSGADPVPAVLIQHHGVGEQVAWPWVQLLVYADDASEDWIADEGWVVIDVATPEHVEGKVSVQVRDGEDILAWAEGTFAADLCELQ